jgi:hypothetical protein
MKKLKPFIHKYKYELLLLALIQHLFTGIVLTDMDFYIRVVWPINMVLLGIASIGVFFGKSKTKNFIRIFLVFLVFFFPVCLPFLGTQPYFMAALNITYVFFFGFIFWEVLKFLMKPSYIDTDVIVASACGFFLLLEISVFLMQLFLYQNTSSFKGIDLSSGASAYIDLVYFCSITFTSIGFGDITPNSTQTKLITSFLGIVGQFYSVVLVGILISKFSSKEN